MTTTAKVAEVEFACDTIECGYRIVRLADGRHAFVWGNIAARVGDVLPDGRIADPTADIGIEVYPTWAAARQACIDCAEALAVTSERLGAELRGRIADTVED